MASLEQIHGRVGSEGVVWQVEHADSALGERYRGLYGPRGYHQEVGTGCLVRGRLLIKADNGPYVPARALSLLAMVARSGQKATWKNISIRRLGSVDLLLARLRQLPDPNQVHAGPRWRLRQRNLLLFDSIFELVELADKELRGRLGSAVPTEVISVMVQLQFVLV